MQDLLGLWGGRQVGTFNDDLGSHPLGTTGIDDILEGGGDENLRVREQFLTRVNPEPRVVGHQIIPDLVPQTHQFRDVQSVGVGNRSVCRGDGHHAVTQRVEPFRGGVTDGPETLDRHRCARQVL